ncbi:unnamed protein product, partial [Brachionus calyciflorus]
MDQTPSKIGAIKNNHYLMPLNKPEEDTDESKQHLFFQNLGPNYSEANLNFNYSSSDNEN